jgi:hypothetical protein
LPPQTPASAQKRPWQQLSPAPPHGWHVPALQLKGAAQKAPVAPAQHRSLSPPHARHTLPTAMVPGAVQPRPPGHGAWPSRPQPPQPLLVQKPLSGGQPASAPMQACVLPLQQPPPAHVVPGQHGWPGAPHGLHWLLAHVRPEAVQKLAAPPLPWQHG